MQESWVEFFMHKCDQDPLRTTMLTSTTLSTTFVLYCLYFGQGKNGWYFTAYFFELVVNKMLHIAYTGLPVILAVDKMEKF